MARGPVSSVGAIIGWVVVAAAIIAIMTLWNWDPIAFVSTTLNRISEVFLEWSWFRWLVGAE